MADGMCAEIRSWAKWQTFGSCRGSPHLSISKTHAESVNSSVIDNFWQLEGCSVREAIPAMQCWGVVLGTS